MARTGRPRLAAPRKRSAPLVLRIEPGLKKELEAAAKENRRSIGEEVRARLRDADHRAARLIQIKDEFGPEMLALLFIVREAVRELENATGKKWFESRWLFDRTVDIFLEALIVYAMPPGEPVRPEELFEPSAAAAAGLPGYPKTTEPLYGGVIEEKKLGASVLAHVLLRVMGTPERGWVEKLPKAEREEWELMAAPGFGRDAWLRERLGPLAERINQYHLGPLALTPDKLRSRVAYHRERRADPEGHEKRMVEEDEARIKRVLAEAEKLSAEKKAGAQ